MNAELPLFKNGEHNLESASTIDRVITPLTRSFWCLHWFLGLRADVWKALLQVFTSYASLIEKKLSASVSAIIVQ